MRAPLFPLVALCLALAPQTVHAQEDDRSYLVALLEDRCREVSGFSQRLAACEGNLQALLEDIFPDLDPQLLEDAEASQDVSFHCPCSRRRSLNALKLLGRAELSEMLVEDGRAELTCHFCNEIYEVNGGELQELIHELTPAA